jgi:hypothetical protein
MYAYPQEADALAALEQLLQDIEHKTEGPQTVQAGWIVLGYGASVGIPLVLSPSPNARQGTMLLLRRLQPHFGTLGNPILTQILQSLLPVLLQYVSELLSKGLGGGTGTTTTAPTSPPAG